MRALYYHSVVERRDPLDHYSALSIQVDEFRCHMRELHRRRCVVSSRSLIEAARDAKPFPEDAVHVSFDDGLRDNFLAAEILASFRLPWTLFVMTDAALNGYVPWYLRLANAVRGATKPVRLSGRRYDLADMVEKRRFVAAAKARVLSVPASDHLDSLDALLKQAGLPLTHDIGDSPFMNVQELRQVSAAGAEIGCHSATHPNLVRCDRHELTREVHESGDRLATAVGSPVDVFSYPDGRYDDIVRSHAAARYALAMGTERSIHESDRHAIPRYSPGVTLAHLVSALEPSYPRQWLKRQRHRRVMRPLRAAARALGLT